MASRHTQRHSKLFLQNKYTRTFVIGRYTDRHNKQYEETKKSLRLIYANLLMVRCTVVFLIRDHVHAKKTFSYMHYDKWVHTTCNCSDCTPIWARYLCLIFERRKL